MIGLNPKLTLLSNWRDRRRNQLQAQGFCALGEVSDNAITVALFVRIVTRIHIGRPMLEHGVKRKTTQIRVMVAGITASEGIATTLCHHAKPRHGGSGTFSVQRRLTAGYGGDAAGG